MNLSNPHHPWLAAHLYYTEPWDTLLRQAVHPLIQRFVQEKVVDGYFFIRYWERGPHVRLRFRSSPDVLENYIRPQLEQWFTDYARQHPSDQSGLPEGADWFPNNSVQFIDYEPEVERYGGTEAIQIAEAQFQQSSRAVLQAMEQSSQWDYDRALGVAIQLHLGFVHRVGMDLEEAYTFLSNLSHRWLPRAYYRPDLSTQEMKALQEQVQQAFARSYARHRTVLIPLFDQVWTGLTARAPFEQPWFQDWLAGTEEIYQALTDCQQQGHLTLPPYYPRPEHPLFSEAQQTRWAIYESYIHMTNNRLGIHNRDEGYLGYLMGESIQELRSSTTVS